MFCIDTTRVEGAAELALLWQKNSSSSTSGGENFQVDRQTRSNSLLDEAERGFTLHWTRYRAGAAQGQGSGAAGPSMTRLTRVTFISSFRLV
jgi:hypothetical protein